MSDPNEYHIGIVCAITIEYIAAQLILDERHPAPACLHRPDHNSYTLGRVGKHKVVIAALPEGEYGTVAAAVGSRDMMHSFPNIKIGLVIGIGGGAPGEKVDIRLGDLVVGLPKDGSSGILQYDFGKTIQDRELQLTRHFDQAPTILRAAVVELRSRMQQGLLLSEKIDQILIDQDQTVFRRPMDDRLFRSDILHQGSNCQECDGTGIVQRSPRETNEPHIHYGLVASADFLMKDAELRDRLSQKHGILCFEMEAAGVVGHFPCLILKGLSDYSDTHKNKDWQGYAALVAAMYAKELLSMIDPTQLLEKQVIEDFSLPFSLPGAPIISTFSGREADLQRIEELLPIPSRYRRTSEPDRPSTAGRRKSSFSSRVTEELRQTVVICGLGGMGKTQLAIEFAKRHSDSYTAILWLDGKDEPSLQASFVNVLNKIKMRYPSSFLVSMESIDFKIAVELALRWLNTTYNNRWLMIFDNVDDPDIPGVTDGLYDVRKYIPTTLHGHVIITTRCLLLRLGQQIKLEKIENRDDCLDILKTVSMRSNLNDDSGVDELLHKLDGLPLALSAAGSYLSLVPDTIKEYLDHYETSWLTLQEETPSLPEHEGRTLELTWNITMRCIKNKDPAAWQVFELWTFLSNQDLWYGLLQAGRDSAAQWFQQITKDRMTFAKHMRTLCSYGLVDVQHEPAGYRIHNCLHDWLGAILPAEKQKELKHLALACITRSIPGMDKNLDSLTKASQCSPEDWPLQRRLLAHADHYSKSIESQASQTSQQDALCHLGYLYLNLNLFHKAEIIFTLVLKHRDRLLGAEHPDTRVVVYLLSLAYRKTYKLKDAEMMCRRILEANELTSKLNNLLAMQTRYNIGRVYLLQSRHLEAETAFLTVKNSISNEPRWCQSETATLLTYLAEVYIFLNRLPEAKALLTESLSLLKDMGEDNDGHLLTCMDMMGQVCAEAHEDVEAEKWLLHVYQRRKTTFGDQYWPTMRTANDLGVLYTEMGRLEEAERILTRTLDGCYATLGTDDYRSCGVSDSLAVVYLRKHELEKAESILTQALTTLEMIVGPENFGALQVAQNLGHVYQAQGKLAEAEPLYVRAYDGFSKKFKEDNQMVIKAMDDLDKIRREQQHHQQINTPESPKLTGWAMMVNGNDILV